MFVASRIEKGNTFMMGKKYKIVNELAHEKFRDWQKGTRIKIYSGSTGENFNYSPRLESNAKST
jgi:hypothetical protein